jgi:hypothetical protein
VLTLGDGEDHIERETGVLLPTFSFMDGIRLRISSSVQAWSAQTQRNISS